MVSLKKETDTVRSYAPMFEFAGGEIAGNAQRFATSQEAEKSAAARFAVWTMPSGYHVAETPDPVNYRWDDRNGDTSLSS
jgi:hypothetical protein